MKIAVIGGGLVGLATAYQLLQRKPGIALTLLEKESDICTHQSGRNSGVIHSGIYYKPGSLKAQNCVHGRKLLIEFCEKYGIAYEMCGKLIVATSADQINSLNNIAERGRANGITITELGSGEAKQIEPAVKTVRALQVKETGIVDYPGVARKLGDLITAAGGVIKTNFPVKKIEQIGQTIRLSSANETLEFDYFVNCAGLYSDKIARLAGAKITSAIIPFRGEYYYVKPEREHLCRHLIYPVPNPEFPFLGVHFTRMIHGGVECGPNAVLAFKREGYYRSSFNLGETLETFGFAGFRKLARRYWRMGLMEMHRSLSKHEFTRSLQELIPEITINDITPAAAGVRAQAVDANGAMVDDFLFHTAERSLHVLNAPSPAATSCLSLGSTISAKLLELTR